MRDKGLFRIRVENLCPKPTLTPTIQAFDGKFKGVYRHYKMCHYERPSEATFPKIYLGAPKYVSGLPYREYMDFFVCHNNYKSYSFYTNNCLWKAA